MKHLITIITLIFISVTIGVAQENTANEVVVNITNLGSNKGQVLVGLYNTKKSFLNKGFRHSKTIIENNSCKIVKTFQLFGRYGKTKRLT